MLLGIDIDLLAIRDAAPLLPLGFKPGRMGITV